MNYLVGFKHFRSAMAVTASAMLLFVARLSGDQPIEGNEHNLAVNPSFEIIGVDRLPQAWGGDPSVFSTDVEVGRGGDHSLKFSNTDGNAYALCTQQVALRPGAKYAFGVWIRTQDIAGDDTGATIALECVDKNGKRTGGFYPPGVKGTRDWTRIHSVVRVSDDTAVGYLTCYPIGLSPTSMVSQWTRETCHQVLGARPVWQVVQVHNQGLDHVWDRSRVRTPTAEEIRHMAWQSLCEGATGLIFYSWDDMKQSPDAPFAGKWEELKRVVADTR